MYTLRVCHYKQRGQVWEDSGISVKVLLMLRS